MELDDDEETEEERDGSDRHLTPPGAHRRRPLGRDPRRPDHGASLPGGASLRGRADVDACGTTGDADGTARDSRSVTVPANAGRSTVGGSAHEIPMPNDPRRVRTSSSNPGAAESRS